MSKKEQQAFKAFFATKKEVRITETVTTEIKIEIPIISPPKRKREPDENQSPMRATKRLRRLEDDEDEIEEPVEDEIEESEVPTKTEQSPITSPMKKEQTQTSPLKAKEEAGKQLLYREFADTLEEVSKTRARLEQQSILSTFFRKVIQNHPKDLVVCIYLCTNQIAPPYMGIELGIGESLIQKAIAEGTGKSMAVIKKEYQTLGDLGLVAEGAVTNIKTLIPPKSLTASFVHKTFLEIANLSGNSSQKKRIDKIRHLMVNCRGPEAKFIVRALQGKMRINLGPKTVLVSVAHAFCYKENKDRKPSAERLAEAALIIEQAYNQLPNWDKVVEVCMHHPLDKLFDHVHLTLGIPFSPMLAQPTKEIDEIFDRLKGKKFTAEWKYDGERAQIHRLKDGTIKIFSRNLDDTTQKFPDVINDISQTFSEDTVSFVLDCEAVAFDRVTGKILPFQILSTRAKKSVKLEEIRVSVCLYAFDLIYLNEKSLLKETFLTRRTLLHKHFKPVEGFFSFATFKDLSEPEEIIPWLEESVKGNCEGLIVKTLEIDATYQAAKRTYQWLKVKKDYLQGMGDTLDLVPIGAYLGKGKRTGVYGGFLLACYDEDNEEYQAICKIGTGFSDTQLLEFTELLKKTQTDKPRNYVRGGDAKPDVWLEPSVVWEVKAADLSISPIYQAAIGLVNDTKGIALRFPRLVRVRHDKGIEQATSAGQVAQMYNNQGINTAGGGGGARDEDD